MNGDFESGNTGFNSDYSLTPNPCCCSTYAIKTNAYAFHPNHWFTRDDHTYGFDGIENDGIGNFFIGDAQCTAGFQRPWYQNVTIQAGVLYRFEAWVSNLDDNIYSNRAIFMISANGQNLFTQAFVINSVGAAGGDARWTQICGEYLATVSGTVEIAVNAGSSISPNDPGLLGADFGLDDISFRAVSPGVASFTYSPQNPCKNEVITFVADELGSQHFWDFGSSSAFPATSTFPTPTVSYSAGGTYWVTHTVSSPLTNCVTIDSVQITINGDCDSVKTCNEVLRPCGSNLITDGGFESFSSSSPSFFSDLPFNNGTVSSTDCNGRYLVKTNSTPWQDDGVTKWQTAADHTFGSGKFMIIDNSCQNLDGAKVFRQFVNVTAGTVYNFSAWVSNLIATNNTPTVALKTRIAGVEQMITQPIAISYDPDPQDKWTRICGSYIPAISGAVEFIVEVGPSNDAQLEADFGLDDVTLEMLSTDNAAFTFAPGDSCLNENIQFDAVEDDMTNHFHYWEFGDGNTNTNADPVHTYNTSGTYTVTHTLTNTVTGCVQVFQLQITIVDCDSCEITADFQITGQMNYTIPPSMLINFTGTPITGSSTFVDGNSHVWTTNGNPPAAQSQIISFTFLKPAPSGNVAIVQYCVSGYTKDVNGVPISECQSCLCEVYNIDGDEPMYERPCNELDLDNILPGGLRKVTGAIEVIASPNPFEGSTRIKVAVNEENYVSLSVHGLDGSEAELLLEGKLTPGVYDYQWTPAVGVKPGMYLLKIQDKSGVRFEKLFLNR